MTGIGDECPSIVACAILVHEADAPNIWGLLSFHHRASASLRSCPYRCQMRYLSRVSVSRPNYCGVDLQRTARAAVLQ